MKLESLFVTSHVGPGPTGAEELVQLSKTGLDRRLQPPFSVQFRLGLSFPESDLIRKVGFASSHIDPDHPAAASFSQAIDS